MLRLTEYVLLLNYILKRKHLNAVFEGGNPSKMGVKPDLKSPPIAGSYPYQYAMQVCIYNGLALLCDTK